MTGWDLLDWTGINNVSGRWYGFWSGIGGDLTLATVPVALWRRHICHTPWCWRLGKHPDGLFMRCARHHDLIPTGGEQP